MMQVLFSHRAKLYRYTDKEYKERGVGDLKLLKDKAGEHYRCLMRRDVVHKICANFTLAQRSLSIFTSIITCTTMSMLHLQRSS